MSQIDILNDYSAANAFVLHGDSLLVHLLKQSQTTSNLNIGLQLDTSCGGQPLAVVYEMERFLNQLVGRGLRILLLFTDAPSLWMTGDPATLSPYARLARAVAVNHFKAAFPAQNLLSDQHSRVTCLHFPEMTPEKWVEILHDTRTPCAFCADDSVFEKLALSSTVDVVYFDGIQFEGSRVLGYCTVSNAQTISSDNLIDVLEIDGVTTSDIEETTSPIILPGPANNPLPSLGLGTIPNLIASALSSVLSSSSCPSSRAINLSLAKATILTFSFLSSVPLVQRCFPFSPWEISSSHISDDLSTVITSFSDMYSSCLARLLSVVANEEGNELVDVHDGRLFLMTLLAACADPENFENSLNAAFLTRSHKMWTGLGIPEEWSTIPWTVIPAATANSILGLFRHARDQFSKELSSMSDMGQRRPLLIPAVRPLLGAISTRLETMETVVTEQLQPVLREFKSHHFHSVRPIEGDVFQMKQFAARARIRQQQSILSGLPVEKMTIIVDKSARVVPAGSEKVKGGWAQPEKKEKKEKKEHKTKGQLIIETNLAKSIVSSLVYNCRGGLFNLFLFHFSPAQMETWLPLSAGTTHSRRFPLRNIPSSRPNWSSWQASRRQTRARREQF